MLFVRLPPRHAAGTDNIVLVMSSSPVIGDLYPPEAVIEFTGNTQTIIFSSAGPTNTAGHLISLWDAQHNGQDSRNNSKEQGGRVGGRASSGQ